MASIGKMLVERVEWGTSSHISCRSALWASPLAGHSRKRWLKVQRGGLSACEVSPRQRQRTHDLRAIIERISQHLASAEVARSLAVQPRRCLICIGVVRGEQARDTSGIPVHGVQARLCQNTKAHAVFKA